jgi:hypothetical protein
MKTLRKSLSAWAFPVLFLALIAHFDVLGHIGHGVADVVRGGQELVDQWGSATSTTQVDVR